MSHVNCCSSSAPFRQVFLPHQTQSIPPSQFPVTVVFTRNHLVLILIPCHRYPDPCTPPSSRIQAPGVKLDKRVSILSPNLTLLDLVRDQRNNTSEAFHHSSKNISVLMRHGNKQVLALQPSWAINQVQVNGGSRPLCDRMESAMIRRILMSDFQNILSAMIFFLPSFS